MCSRRFDAGRYNAVFFSSHFMREILGLEDFELRFPQLNAVLQNP